MPLFFAVASLRRVTLNKARAETLLFLELWGGIAPVGLQRWVRLALGSSVGFALLWGLSQTFNTVGKDIVPHVSAQFSHFNRPGTKWSVDHRQQWETFLSQIRSQMHCKDPNQDLMASRQAFYQFKALHGASPVRAMRTLFLYSFLMFAAGLLDLRLRRFRKRGLVVMSVALICLMGFTFSWSARQASYVSEMFAINDNLGPDCMVQEPSSRLAQK